MRSFVPLSPVGLRMVLPPHFPFMVLCSGAFPPIWPLAVWYLPFAHRRQVSKFQIPSAPAQTGDLTAPYRPSNCCLRPYRARFPPRTISADLWPAVYATPASRKADSLPACAGFDRTGFTSWIQGSINHVNLLSRQLMTIPIPIVTLIPVPEFRDISLSSGRFMPRGAPCDA
jgi:hypothetical protein